MSSQSPARAASLPFTLPTLLVGVSTKAYFTHAKTLDYATSLLTLNNPSPSTLGLFFIPSFPSLPASASILSSASLLSSPSNPTPTLGPGPIYLGAQDCHFTASHGPSTGSIPPAQLVEFGCSLVELGHAERRRAPLSESDALVAQKAGAAASEGLVPLVCIGETARAAEGADVEEGVRVAMKEVGPQVESVLKGMEEGGSGKGERRVVFAYEPVWAIGADRPAAPEHVKGVVRAIKGLAEGRAGQVRVLYGGSAGPGTWEGLKEVVDGLFLGRFSHDVRNVQKVIDEVLQ